MSAFVFPAAVLASHVAIIGKTGSGKTSTGKLAVEQAVAEGARVCILDPIKSDWWGVTSSADGKRPGLPFKILGGPHGHVPLHSGAGAAIGQLVGEGKLPLSIIDMADFEAGGLQRFFVEFATSLLRHSRGVLHLVMEEAHEFAPKERAGIGQENLALHWSKKLATAGRSRGIRLLLGTQRVQSLHNAMLGSAETLVIHRLTAPADQEPVMKWLKANVTKVEQTEVEASLSSLPTGTGWLLSGEAALFQRVEFPKFATYDNHFTPEGDAEADGVIQAAVDPDELKAIIGEAVAQALANDPKHLKAEVVKLRADLAKVTDVRNRVAAPDPAAIKAIEEAAYQRGHSDGHLYGYKFAKADSARAAQALADELTRESGKTPEKPAEAPRAVAAPTPPRPAPATPASPPAPSAVANGGGGESTVPHGCAKPLAALAAVYPSGLTEAQWALSAGFKRTGGTWGTYKGRMKTAGLVEQRDGRWFATGAGAAAAGDVERPPAPGPDLVRWWAAKLHGTPPIANALIEVWPNPITKEDLALRVGMSASGGTFGTYLGRLAGPGLIERSGGMVRLTDEAMYP